MSQLHCSHCHSFPCCCYDTSDQVINISGWMDGWMDSLLIAHNQSKLVSLTDLHLPLPTPLTDMGSDQCNISDIPQMLFVSHHTHIGYDQDSSLASLCSCAFSRLRPEGFSHHFSGSFPNLPITYITYVYKHTSIEFEDTYRVGSWECRW